MNNYDFKVDEWELETGNSQPHSDESKLNLRPTSAVATAAQRRIEQTKKAREARNEMIEKLDKDRNPTFTKPVAADKKPSKPPQIIPAKSENEKQVDQVEETHSFNEDDEAEEAEEVKQD